MRNNSVVEEKVNFDCKSSKFIQGNQLMKLAMNYVEIKNKKIKSNKKYILLSVKPLDVY